MAGAAPPCPLTAHIGRTITKGCDTHRGGEPARYGIGAGEDLVCDLTIETRRKEPGRVGDHYTPAGSAIRTSDLRDCIEAGLQRRAGTAVVLGHPQFERASLDERGDGLGATAGGFRRSGVVRIVSSMSMSVVVRDFGTGRQEDRVPCMGEMIELENDAALPGGARQWFGARVLVIQEWWGLNPQMKGTADHLAENGFVALALISTEASSPAMTKWTRRVT